MDFVFILDGLGSIFKKNWGWIKEFVKCIVDVFDVFLDGIYFVLFEYSIDFKVYFRFNDFVDV